MATGKDAVIAQGEAEQVEEPAEVLARAAAIDVAKDTGMVCTRLPHETRAGRKVQQVWNVTARYEEILALGDHLRCQGIERVVLESTSDYWRIWFYLLEAAGLTVWLVNAAMSSTPRAGPRATNSMPSGCANSTNGACCGPRSSRRLRSGTCAR